MMPRTMGKLERLFHERQARDLELCARKGGHPQGFVFHVEAGEHVVNFIEKHCRHHKGEWAGKRLILEEWQKEIKHMLALGVKLELEVFASKGDFRYVTREYAPRKLKDRDWLD